MLLDFNVFPQHWFIWNVKNHEIYSGIGDEDQNDQDPPRFEEIDDEEKPAALEASNVEVKEEDIRQQKIKETFSKVKVNGTSRHWYLRSVNVYTMLL